MIDQVLRAILSKLLWLRQGATEQSAEDIRGILRAYPHASTFRTSKEWCVVWAWVNSGDPCGRAVSQCSQIRPPLRSANSPTTLRRDLLH